MRFIDADKLCEDLLNRWSIADEKKEELIQAVMTDVVTPIIACQSTVSKWIPCIPETMPKPNENVIMQCRGKKWPSGYRYFQTIGCWIPRYTVKSEDKWTDLPDDSCEEYCEEKDDYYCLEGWYEECTQGDGDCQSWFMNADVIAWQPLPETYKGEDGT